MLLMILMFVARIVLGPEVSAMLPRLIEQLEYVALALCRPAL